VMPPASPATTLADRIRSSNSVLPWSTWTHDGDHRRARLLTIGIVVVGVVEERLQLHLLLLAGIDEQHVGADLEGEQLELLVGERHRGRDHLAVLQQEAHDVGRGAVQLRPVLLGRGAPLDDDRALGHRRVGRRVRRHLLRLQLLDVPPATTPGRTARGPALRVGTAPGATEGRDGHHRDHRYRDLPGPGTGRAPWTAAGATEAAGRGPPGRPAPTPAGRAPTGPRPPTGPDGRAEGRGRGAAGWLARRRNRPAAGGRRDGLARRRNRPAPGGCGMGVPPGPVGRAPGGRPGGTTGDDPAPRAGGGWGWGGAGRSTGARSRWARGCS
jgi:hypothetical protein